MKSVFVKGFVAVVVLMLIAGCATQGDEPAEVLWRTVEHRNTALGGAVPGWVTTSVTALESSSDYQNDYVFVIEKTGRNLEGARTLANNMDLRAEIAAIVEVRVQQTFAGAQVGDQDFVETYFENVVRTLVDTELSGVRKRDEFWVRQLNNETQEERYVYYSLFTIPREILDAKVQESVTGTPAVTEEEQTAQNRVREIFAEGL